LTNSDVSGKISSMNRYSSIFTPKEYEELARRNLKASMACPTCKGAGKFVWNGVEYDCEKDDDDICIQKKLFLRYELANIPRRFQRLDWSDLVNQPEAKATAEDYIEHSDNALALGVGLYIFSPGLGTGKTFLATHILKEFVKLGHIGYYVAFFDILDLHRREPEDRAFIENKLLSSSIIVIDDVVAATASQKQADHYRNTLERVVRHRAHNDLPTIITSNLTSEQLDDEYDRIFSLMSDSLLPLELDSSSDFRIMAGLANRAKALLNGETPPIT
jgi:DNA replication protein DnaC